MRRGLQSKLAKCVFRERLGFQFELTGLGLRAQPQIRRQPILPLAGFRRFRYRRSDILQLRLSFAKAPNP